MGLYVSCRKNLRTAALINGTLSTTSRLGSAGPSNGSSRNFPDINLPRALLGLSRFMRDNYRSMMFEVNPPRQFPLARGVARVAHQDLVEP